MLDVQKTKTFVDGIWEDSILPALVEFIRIPNKSPAFDPDWQKHGHMDSAVQLLVDWCLQQAIPGMKLEVIRRENRTPLIFMDIPGQTEDTILLYGHLDKQPEMAGWDEDLGPWKPVLRDGKLYGRGGADDGYACFASLAAIKALQEQNIPHGRCVVLIEASEESGSPDLMFYIEELKDRIGNPNLVICLDSGCGNYNQLWAITSLRGLISGVLHIEVLTQGIHSGEGGGVVPAAFQVARQLLSRIEDEKTGKIILQDLCCEIPEQRQKQAAETAKILGTDLYRDYPFAEGVQPLAQDHTQLILNRTWYPALAVTGADHLPGIANAGNVILPKLSLKISIRIPPQCDAEKAITRLQEVLEANPPFGARVQFEKQSRATGWVAPIEAPWLAQASQQASEAFFGAPAMYMGEGGTIPFMGMLGKKFPQAQFLITGVLGPHSNAHGPNEFLHIAMAKGLTGCVAHVIAEHYQAHV